MSENRVQLPLFKDPTELPTGKHHISFSELQVWTECSWRHKLLYIDKLLPDAKNEHLIFGSIMHDALETFILNYKSCEYSHQANIDNAVAKLKEQFAEISFEDKNNAWETGLINILNNVEGWLNQEFPGWQPVAAELMLFEKIEGQKNKYFKGYMDIVIKMPKPARKGSKPKDDSEPIEWIYVILDWKGTLSGWTLDKKMDPIKKMQLILYKHYLCEKFGLDLKQVKCGFVLCKRKPPKEQSNFELVEVSVGPETIKKTLEKVEKMVFSVAKRLYQKNRNSCKYCQFAKTEKCPG